MLCATAVCRTLRRRRVCVRGCVCGGQFELRSASVGLEGGADGGSVVRALGRVQVTPFTKSGRIVGHKAR